MNFSRFESREQAGRRLGEKLKAMAIADPLVLALPRGGVPVAAEVAKILKAPLDLLLVRKIGVPWQSEVAAAAVVDGERHDLVLNEEAMAMEGMHRADVEALVPEQLAEIERRRKLYLGERVPVSAEGRSVILTDDGIATGTTIRAAIRALKRRNPKRLILAIPVAPSEAVAALAREADHVVCLEQPKPFYAIGEYYTDFHQLGDDEVIALMKASS